MTLNSTLNGQQLELENTTNYEYQLQQRQSQAAVGQRYIDIVWAAGLFEGEGCISTPSRNNCIKRVLYIGMTDKDVMERFVSVVGYGNLNGPQWKQGGTKPVWQWSIERRPEVLRILKMFLPHLGKRRAEKAIEAITHIHETIN